MRVQSCSTANFLSVANHMKVGLPLYNPANAAQHFKYTADRCDEEEDGVENVLKAVSRNLKSLVQVSFLKLHSVLQAIRCRMRGPFGPSIRHVCLARKSR